MSDIASHDRQPMLERSCSDQQIRAAVADARAEPTPSTSDPRVDRENAVATGFDSALEPRAERLGKSRVLNLLSKNTSFDLADRDGGKKQRIDSLVAQPSHDAGMPLPLTQLGQHNRIDQVHQNPTFRGLTRLRSNEPSSRGMSRMWSAKFGASAVSRWVRRRYSATESTTTAGLPRLVTVCGAPLTAAATTALKLFFASCSDHKGAGINPILAS